MALAGDDGGHLAGADVKSETVMALDSPDDPHLRQVLRIVRLAALR